MQRRTSIVIGVLIAGLIAYPALADLGYNPGSQVTIFDFICFVTKHCSAHVNINSGGTEIATQSNPMRIDPTGTTPQPVSQSGAWTVGPATASAWGIGTTGSSVPSSANYWGINISGNLVGSTGLALGATTKAATVAIVDGSGNQITSFGSVGGTSSNFGSAFPTPGTAVGFTDGTNMVAGKVRNPGSGASTSDPAVVVADPNLLAAANSQIPAGTNLIGKVGIDQTTPGTTNGVQVNAALPAGTNNIGKTTPNDGTNSVLYDPCQSTAKTYTPINVATATNVIVTGVSAKKKYVCFIFIYPGATVNFAVYQATTGTSCVTSPADIFGGHTTGTGFLATATAGFVAGTGSNAIAATNTNNTDICVTNGGSVQLSGVIVTVDQ